MWWLTLIVICCIASCAAVVTGVDGAVEELAQIPCALFCVPSDFSAEPHEELSVLFPESFQLLSFSFLLSSLLLPNNGMASLSPIPGQKLS